MNDRDSDRPSETPTRTRNEPGSPKGTTIGHYRLLQKLGEGGMGEVWEAEQEEPVRRRVALKLVRQDLASKEVIARFESERQALALMDHPAIAKVFDAGVTDGGRPYFVMEYIQGVPITEYCDVHRLSVHERLELFRRVCEGIQHAHQKAIIHRDIKPSNVLVTTQDGKPAPKIIDFGVAKATAQRLTEHTVFTEMGQLIGTPEYMSPEQAEMTGENVDTRTDVYSLGAVLYELLVGTRVFDRTLIRRAAFDEIRRTIREVDPPRPSTRVSGLGEESTTTAHRRRTTAAALVGQLRGDLDWIVMKSLEKDRNRRYGSPAELAEDVGRHIRHEPVLARPPSTAYRVGKFTRRHRVGVTAAALVAAALVAGVVAATWGLVRARRAEVAAKQEAATAEQVSGFLLDIFKASDPTQKDRGASVTARELLDRAVARIDKLADQPLVQARMMHSLAGIQNQLGQFDAAASLAKDALATRQRILGSDNADVLESLHLLAVVLFQQQRFAEGEPICRQALDVARRLKDDTRVATELNNLSNYLASRDGDYKEIEALRREALAVMRKLHGDQDPRVAVALVNVAEFASTLEEQEAMMREALEIDRKGLGEDHPTTIEIGKAVAEILLSHGKPDEAEPMLRQGLATAERVLGVDHPMTITLVADLGWVFRARGDYAGSEPFYRETLVRRKRVLGPEHAYTMRATWQLARALVQQGRYAEGEPLAREALAIGRRVPPGNDNLASALYWLGLALDGEGKHGEAERTLRDALAMWGKTPGPPSQAASTMTALGRSLAAQGRFADAESSLQKSYELLKADPKSEPAALRASVESLEGLYRSWDKSAPRSGHEEQAAKWRAEGLTLARAK